MCPEGEHKKHGSNRCRDQKPWAVSSPSRLGLIGKSAYDRVIDRIPESGKKHQGRYCGHADSKNICIKNHQKVTDKHPAEITAYISKAICDLTDQWHFSVFEFVLHDSSRFLILFFLNVDDNFHGCFTVIINIVICFQIIFECKYL